jgi:hypothetical protein
MNEDIEKDFGLLGNENRPPTVLRQISDFGNYDSITPKTTKPIRNSENLDLSYTFRPSQEVGEMRKLKEKVEKLERAYEDSHRVWQR